jgi:transcriptional regulator with XRE-family HTH domain
MTIRRWESGEREPRASDIKKLCEVLGCTEVELLNGPQPGEWKIEIIWEVEELNALSIESDKFCVGFRGDDILLWGAVPGDKTPDEAAERIRRELDIAVKMREIRKAELRKGEA